MIGDKVPPSMATRIASSASGTGQATLSPSATLAAARKPCEIEPSIDTAVSQCYFPLNHFCMELPIYFQPACLQVSVPAYLFNLYVNE